ncbi:MAG TPA: TraB/GumN family protein [Taishania sp.]|nr:TraB/GumN family protein [Taishania sp.]
MKRLSLLFVAFFITQFVVFGQYLNEIPTKSNTLLWKIEGNKLKKPSYLFGTIHLIDKDLYYFPEHFKQLVLNAEQVVLELPEINPMEAMAHLVLKEGTVFDYFKPQQRDSLLTWASKELGMDTNQFIISFSKMKPFSLVQIASQKDLEGKIESYDMNIQALAKANNIPVLGLETIADQMAIFDGMDTLTMQEMVMEYVRDPKGQMESLNEMFQLYLNQNVDEMHEFTTKSEGYMMNYSKQLLDDRNMNWIPKIEKLIKKKKTLIAVGAGHLGGQNGVLRLLEKQGYTLSPVEF